MVGKISHKNMGEAPSSIFVGRKLQSFHEFAQRSMLLFSMFIAGCYLVSKKGMKEFITHNITMA